MCLAVSNRIRLSPDITLVTYVSTHSLFGRIVEKSDLSPRTLVIDRIRIPRFRGEQMHRHLSVFCASARGELNAATQPSALGAPISGAISGAFGVGQYHTSAKYLYRSHIPWPGARLRDYPLQPRPASTSFGKVCSAFAAPDHTRMKMQCLHVDKWRRLAQHVVSMFCGAYAGD